MAEKDENIISEEVKVDSSSTIDQASYTKSGFELSLNRSLISLKNHIYKVPMLVTILSTIFFYCTIFIKVRAIFILPNNNAVTDFYTAMYSTSGMLFFFTALFSILFVVAYMNANGKHVTSKKKWSMMTIYYIMAVAQIALDVMLILTLNKYITDHPDIGYKVNDSVNMQVMPVSVTWSWIHIITLCLAIVLSILAIVLQPAFKKIKVDISFKKKI